MVGVFSVVCFLAIRTRLGASRYCAFFFLDARIRFKPFLGVFLPPVWRVLKQNLPRSTLVWFF